MTADEKKVRDRGLEFIVGFDYEGSRFEVWAEDFEIKRTDVVSLCFEDVVALRDGKTVEKFPTAWNGSKTDIGDALTDAVAAYCRGCAENGTACAEVEELRKLCGPSGFKIDGREVPETILCRRMSDLEEFRLDMLTETMALYGNDDGILVTDPSSGKIMTDQTEFSASGLATSVLRGDKVLFVDAEAGERLAELCDDAAETNEEKAAAAAFRTMIPAKAAMNP